MSQLSTLSFDGEKLVVEADKLGTIAVAKDVSLPVPQEESASDSNDASSDLSSPVSPSYNAVANLVAGYDVEGEKFDLYLNAATDGKTMEQPRESANAVAVAGDGFVTLTVPVEPSYAQAGLALGSLGAPDGAGVEASLSGDGLTATFRLTERADSYELSGSADYYGYASSSMRLDVSVPSEVLDEAFGCVAPVSASTGFAAGAYAVTANLYALDDGGNPVFLSSVPPDGVGIGASTDENGLILNGARSLTRYDGTTTLDVWLDESVSYDSLGASSNVASAQVLDDQYSLFHASFVLSDLSGRYDFSGASVTKNGVTYTRLFLRVDYANATDLYSSNVAPNSGNDDLAPGTYEVTANLYVPGEYNPILVGYNAYMGSPEFPPTRPVYPGFTPDVEEDLGWTYAGTLTVNDDHTATLDLPINCTAFTLQSVGGSENARVTDVEWGTDSTVLGILSKNGINGYITHLTFSLDDLSTGFYVFTDCSEFPVPFEQVWNLPLYLKVDLGNAHTPGENPDNPDEPGNYEETLTDASGAISLDLTASSAVVANKWNGATLVVERIVSGEDYSKVNSEIASLFSRDDASFAMYDIQVLDADGLPLDLSAFDSAVYRLIDTRGVFGIPENQPIYDALYYFTYNGETLERFAGNNSFANGFGSAVVTDWNATESGSFVLVYPYTYASGVASKVGLPVSLELADVTGVSVVGSLTDYQSAIKSDDFGSLKLLSSVESNGDKVEKAQSALAELGSMPYDKCNVKAIATAIARIDGSYIQTWAYSSVTDTYVYKIPVDTPDSTIYLITVDSAGDSSCQPIPESNLVITNDGAEISWTMPRNWDEKVQVIELFKALYRGATGDPNNEGYAYYAVVSNGESDKIVPTEPVATSDLIYSGAAQTGVIAGEGYTLSGDFQATDAGTYKALATLDAGYVWKDGSKDAKTIEWSIAKAMLTATYAGEQVMRGVEPGYAVSVEGFVDGENVTNADEFVMPAIADKDKPAASELVAGFFKELAPSGGSAKNYQFKYVGGTLKVVAAAGDLKPGTYTVTANLFVPGELNAVLVGVNAYLTNPSTPLTDGSAPTKPVSDNATLTVAEDGTITLDLDVVNPVFTLQKIGGGTNAQATVTGKGDSVGASDAQYKTRISKLSIKLLDSTGTYIFSDCLEYPTLLNQVWTVPLTLNVDFSNVDTVEPAPDPTPDPKPDQPVQVAVPAAKANLTYNGKTQTGVAASKAYTLVGATAKDAGTYTATATLNEGYEWADGTTGAKTVTWTIAKAKLTATYAGETIVEGGEPAYAVDVTGFVGGDTVLTAEGFEAPSVSKVAADQLVAGKSFTLTPAGGAAKNYSYIYVAGTLKVTAPVGTIAPGTYQVTANLYVPGELNSVLGKNAYLTNPSTPITDGNAPLTPVSDNAKLVVRSDGSRVLVIPVVNPVFTLQGMGDGANVKVLGSVRGNDVVGSTQVSDRITELYVELGDDSGSYQLGDCVEFPTLLNQTWNVPLRISVDFASMKQLSNSSTITVPGQNGTDKPGNGTNGGSDNNGGNGSNNNGNQGNNSGTNNGANGGGQGNNGTGDNANNGGNNGQGTTGNVDNSDGSYRLTAGTYTVTANIWLSDRSATGLPLMPYLTSGDFPPMYPVTGNATLTVDESGHATLRVPIAIQSKVMTVSGISGLDIVGTEYSGGYVSAVTIDLGTITDMSGVITQSCSATIVMGSLASTISGITGSHTWPATFQVVFTGVPVSSNAGSSYDWSKAAAAAGLTAGVGELAAEGTGAAADLEFLSVATKAATQGAMHAAAGAAEASVAENTAADFVGTGVSGVLTALDPDAASGTDATAALALAAALTGGEVATATGAEAFEAAFLAGKAA